MKRRTLVSLALVLAVLLALGWYFFGGQKVPAGQPALFALTPANFSSLRNSFNAANGNVRVVLLFSPT
ncbi:MAG: hypothetical protein ACRD50_15085 [Candidatus Acidiferrales bacterium]